MAEKKENKKDDGKPVVLKDTHVEVHLDKDPNDPRNVKKAEALPSLNDKK